jgi:hypothetical protein
MRMGDQVVRYSWLAQVGEFREVKGSSKVVDQMEMGNQVFRCFASTQRGCMGAPHDHSVHITAARNSGVLA